MKVEAILKAKDRRVATIRPDSTIETAIHRLSMERVGALIVSADDEHVLGLLSERDIIHGLEIHGDALLEQPVEALTNRGVPTCSPDDSINQVMVKMTRSRVRHLPVVDGGRLVGIVSIGDAVKVRLSEIELETSVLRDAFIANR